MGITGQGSMGLTARECGNCSQGIHGSCSQCETYSQGSVRLVARDTWALLPDNCGTCSQGCLGQCGT